MNPGTRIGQYRVGRKLGAGAMGAVYQAEHELLGRTAAIKELLPALSAQRDAIDRFFNEARATSSIADPGIVQIFDFGFHTDGTAYIVMELLEGESLEARIERLGRIPPADALRIVSQAASSLTAAHVRGIVHRDLKPDNIVMVRDPVAQGGERPKIFDFGIAKLGGEVSARMTASGTMLGTPLYMPPEQARGADQVDARADVYSLGCVLFQMLTGQPPFDGENGFDIIAAHMREPATAPSHFVPEIPACVDELVLRCLEKDPDDRVSSMAELQVECGARLAQIQEPALAIGATLSPRPAPSRFRTSPLRLRPSLTAAAALTLAAAATFAVALQLTHHRSDTAAAVATPLKTRPAMVAPVAAEAPPPTPTPALAAPGRTPEGARAPTKPTVKKRTVKAKQAHPSKRAGAPRREHEALYETR